MEEEKSLKRSVRRHHAQRLKKKRKNHYGFLRPGIIKSERLLGILVHTSKICNQMCCCNPRKYGEDSICEQSDQEVLKYELEELAD